MMIANWFIMPPGAIADLLPPTLLTKTKVMRKKIGLDLLTLAYRPTCSLRIGPIGPVLWIYVYN